MQLSLIKSNLPCLVHCWKTAAHDGMYMCHGHVLDLIFKCMSQMDNLTAGLEAKEYETKTQGTRRVEAARTVGEGDVLHASGLSLDV